MRETYENLLYDEEISPITAAQILGEESLGEDVTCKLITTLHETTLLVKNNVTGVETEYPLNEDGITEEDVPKIESSRRDIIGTGFQLGKVLNGAISALIVILSLAAIATLVWLLQFK